MLKMEGCSGWGGLRGDCSAGGVAGCFMHTSPPKEHLGNLWGMTLILKRTHLPSLLSIFISSLSLFHQVRGVSAVFLCFGR